MRRGTTRTGQRAQGLGRWPGHHRHDLGYAGVRRGAGNRDDPPRARARRHVHRHRGHVRSKDRGASRGQGERPRHGPLQALERGGDGVGNSADVAGGNERRAERGRHGRAGDRDPRLDSRAPKACRLPQGWTNVLLLACWRCPSMAVACRAHCCGGSGGPDQDGGAATRVSQALAVAMMAIGRRPSWRRASARLWLVFTGRSTVSAASAERRAAGAEVARAASRRRHDTGPRDDRAERQQGRVARAAAAHRQLGLAVIDEYGDVIGLVGVLAVERLPERRREWVAVRKMLNGSPVPLALAGNPLHRAAVPRAGRLVGRLSMSDHTVPCARVAGARVRKRRTANAHALPPPRRSRPNRRRRGRSLALRIARAAPVPGARGAAARLPGVLDGSASAGATGVGWIALHPAPVEEGAERARQHGYDRDRIRL
jgi:hypothetical protein